MVEIAQPSQDDDMEEFKIPTVFFTGLDGKTWSLEWLSIKTLVIDVKKKLQNKHGCDPSELRMIYMGKEFQDGWATKPFLAT
jgi:hypothetical protein